MPQRTTLLDRIVSGPCPGHLWKLERDISPKETKIKGVFYDFTFLIDCEGCERKGQAQASDMCPYCFTHMEDKPVDTAAARFKHHPDHNLDPYHRAVIHACPTCNGFRCVTFIHDH